MRFFVAFIQLGLVLAAWSMPIASPEADVDPGKQICLITFPRHGLTLPLAPGALWEGSAHVAVSSA